MIEKNCCFSMFPQIIGIYTNEEHLNLKLNINNIISHYQNTEYEDINDFCGPSLKHFFNKHDKNLFNNEIYDLTVFKNFLLDSVKSYSNELGYVHSGFVVTDCWINICNKNGYQAPHNHANSFISGTYYINFDPEIHSRLCFRNPFSTGMYSIPSINLDRSVFHNHPNSEEYECNIYEEGDLVLWQSGLSHAYRPCFGDNRISISMNFLPKYIKSGSYSVEIKDK